MQYEASTLPAKQMGQTVLPEKFTEKQQKQSRLDGGIELDGSQRKYLPVTAPELPGHHELEKRKANKEGRPPVSMYCFIGNKRFETPVSIHSIKDNKYCI